MADKFLPRLSQNLLDILDDEEYYDITIEVGNDPYVKIFRAHMVILSYRSSYLRRILLTNKKDGTLVHIKLPNILPEIFQIILMYIYGGKLSLEECDISDIIKILLAANELSLQELVSYLQSFLIENKASWMEQNFDLIYRASFENCSFLELQKYCIDLISKEPDKIFRSPNFSSIQEKLLVQIIQDENLQMSEIQIWEHILKWGFAQNPGFSTNPKSISKDEFNVLKNTLQKFIPFIRFYDLAPKEFSDKVLPYKKVLPKELYKDLVEHFMNSSDKSKPSITRGTNKGIKLESQTTEDAIEIKSEPTKETQETQEAQSESQIIKEPIETQSESQIPKECEETQLQSQMIKESKETQSESHMTKEINSSNIDSKIILSQHFELISSWIDSINCFNTYNLFSSWFYKPNSYEFKLLFRGSRDGFVSSDFHNACDNKSPVVMIIKVRNSSEILGGYNPIGWKSDYSCGTTKESFIFSFKNKNNKDYILSPVEDETSAIVNSPYCFPTFGNGDLVISGYNNNYCSCKRNSYKNSIREIEDLFSVEEYEIFQIIKIDS